MKACRGHASHAGSRHALPFDLHQGAVAAHTYPVCNTLASKETHMLFERNVGGIDRAARIALGLALMVSIPFLDSPLRWIGLFGMVPLFTGLVSYCPLYTLLGLRTCALPKA
jgi:hypothetical protein